MNNERGFTLAEMLVVCAIVGLVMASLLGLVMSGQQAYWFGTTQVDAQQTTRVALERMVKEIREAGYEPLAPNPAACPPPLALGYCFDALASGQTATSLTLQYNWNGSNTTSHIDAGAVNDPLQCPTGTPCRGERITYSFSSGNLTRQEIGVDATPVVIASGITGLTFSYFADDGTTTATTANIRTVGITVTAQTANKGAYVTMTDRVRLRNR